MIRPLALFAVLLLVAVGCTPASSPAPQPGTPQPGTPGASVPAADSAVSIIDDAFNPSTVQVSTGTTVTWTNNDDEAHTVTFADGPDSGALSPGGTYERTFNEAGTFAYVCTIHSGMAGSVTVQ